MSEHVNKRILKLQRPASQTPPPPPPPVAQDPQPQYQPPPPQNQPPQHQPPNVPSKPPSKAPIAILIIIVLVIAAIAAAILFMGGAQKSPDNTFDTFVDRINAEDFKGAYDLTTMVFDDDYNDIVKDAEASQEEYGDEYDTEYSVDIDETRYEDDMSSSEIEDMEDSIDDLEKEYGVEVEDFCIVEYTMTVTMTIDGETETDTNSDDMPCVKIDGKWYVVLDLGYGAGSSSTPAGAWNDVSAVDQTSVKLVFGQFTTDVQPLDIKIFVEVDGTPSGWITIPSNTDSSPQACIWTSGQTGASVTYTDFSPAGGLINSGDHMIITGLSSGTTYSFEVFHIPTDATIYMTGDSPTVQTPAYSTPAGAWNSAEATSQTEGKITFGRFTTDVQPMDIKIFVRANGVSIGEITFINNTEATPYDLTWTGGPSGAVASYTDYNYAGGLINSGDYISFTGLSSGTTYSFEILYIPSDSVVSMTGASGSFMTPA